MAEIVYVISVLLIFSGVVAFHLKESLSNTSSDKLPYLDKLPWSINFDFTVSKEFKKLSEEYGEGLVKTLLNDYLSRCEEEQIPIKTLLELSPSSYRRLSSFSYKKFLITLIMLDIEDELDRRAKKKIPRIK